MMRTAVLALMGALALPAASVTTTTATAATYHRPLIRTGLNANQSTNWSGYNQGSLEKNNTQFTQISGQWNVPTATAHKAGEHEFSSTWVGIGGGCVDAGCTVGDNTLIQAGTEQDVTKAGVAKYSAWWEIIPQPS